MIATKNLGFLSLFRKTGETCITTPKEWLSHNTVTAFRGKKPQWFEKASWEWKDLIWGLKNEYYLCKNPSIMASTATKMQSLK